MKILGIDYGRVKVGLALGDTVTKLVEPLFVLSSEKFKVQSSKLITTYEIHEVVVGVPGGKIEEEIKEFGEDLRRKTGLPIKYCDETLSTQDAQELMINNDNRRKYRKEMEDAVAAAIMLQYYLEAGKL